jgi:hypothetical protein
VHSEDYEETISARTTITVIRPDASRQDYSFVNVAVANLAFNTTGQASGIYQVEVKMEDSYGKATTVKIGSFEIKPAPASFPLREATLGISVIGLVILILILLLVFRRFPTQSASSPPPAPPTPPSPPETP